MRPHRELGKYPRISSVIQSTYEENHNDFLMKKIISFSKNMDSWFDSVVTDRERKKKNLFESKEGPFLLEQRYV